MQYVPKPIAIGYRRVSTAKQGQSGLGLDAQDAAIQALCSSRGLTLVESFTEVESGKNDERPQLALALAKARKLRGILVIAKLDRLGRRVSFISALMESGTPFMCADAPDDEPFIQHIKASFAEEEARKISQRTKAALAQTKARGVVLGNPKLTSEIRAKGGAVMAARAEAEHAKYLSRILALRELGKSIRAIATEVGVSPMTVSRILKKKSQ
jgi:DNA invertase Pin-like site-specific DNA recombinase